MPRATKSTTSAKKAPVKKAASKATPAKKPAASARKTSAKPAPVAKKAPAKKAPAKKAAVKASPKKATPKATRPAKKAPVAKKAPAGKKVPTPKAAPPAKKAGVKPPAKKVAAPTKAPVKKIVPPKKGSPLDKFFEAQRQELLDERENYTRQATALRAEADQLAQDREPGDVQFDEESGMGDSMNVERERDLALSAQALGAVDEIDKALIKIDIGSYGICEKCGENIPRERLRALPYAALCVSCKSMGLSRR